MTVKYYFDTFSEQFSEFNEFGNGDFFVCIRLQENQVKEKLLEEEKKAICEQAEELKESIKVFAPLAPSCLVPASV